MTWQVSLVLFFATSVSLNLWRRYFSQKNKLHDKVTPALSYILGVVPLGIIVGLALGDVKADITAKLLFQLVFMALCIGLFNWLSFKSLKQLSVAAFLTLLQLATVTSIILGWVLLGEGLESLQVLGSILLLYGAVLAAQAHQSKRKVPFRGSAASLAVIGAVSLGAGVATEKAILEHVSLSWYFIYGFGLQALALVIIGSKQLAAQDFRALTKFDWWGSALLGVLSAVLGFFFINTLVKADNVSLVVSLTTFQLPLSALASYIILKEKENSKKLYLGLMVGFVGLLLTAL